MWFLDDSEEGRAIQLMLDRMVNPNARRPLVAESMPVAKKELPLRYEQIVKERCQTVAKLMWKQNPNYTTTELSEHPDIRNGDITDAGRYQPRTIYDWIAEVDPRAQKDKIGRPANKLKIIRNNLRS